MAGDQGSRSPVATKRRSVPGQVMIVATGTLLSAALVFVTTRIYAQRFPPEQFSIFLLIRLYASVLAALGVLGMPVSLLRNVAAASSDSRRAASLANAGMLIGALGLTVVFSVSMVFVPWLVRYTGSDL